MVDRGDVLDRDRANNQVVDLIAKRGAAKHGLWIEALDWIIEEAARYAGLIAELQRTFLSIFKAHIRKLEDPLVVARLRNEGRVPI
eukprot:72673-Alexandrium_andersonii.AAC.1